MKQLQTDPWTAAAEKYTAGERIRGVVTRVTDFGAFVELEPGIEGLIHLSELSWSKKVRKPADVVKPGDSVEVVVLGVSAGERRISLGLKQALGDPWEQAEKRFPVGSVVEGPITSLTKFGAFVQLDEAIEGMIHVGDISAEKRINHPQEALKAGQAVKAAVLEVDRAKRRIRLGLKQLQPTSIDEYIAEHKEGDLVSGRLVDVRDTVARVELGEGIQAYCSIGQGEAKEAAKSPNRRPIFQRLLPCSPLNGSTARLAGRRGKRSPLVPVRFAASASRRSTPEPRTSSWNWRGNVAQAVKSAQPGFISAISGWSRAINVRFRRSQACP